MSRQRIDAVQMTRRIREMNQDRFRGMSRSERLAYYREQARLMNEKASVLVAKGRRPERA